MAWRRANSFRLQPPRSNNTVSLCSTATRDLALVTMASRTWVRPAFISLVTTSKGAPSASCSQVSVAAQVATARCAFFALANEMEKRQTFRVLGQTQTCQLAHQLTSLATFGQQCEFAPQGLHLGDAVQPQQLSQGCRRVFLQVFRTFDAQQSQKKQSQHGGS